MDILRWPHPSLKRACDPVVPFGDTEFKAQLQEMQRVAGAARGIGLAANQVGLNKRMLVARGDGGWQWFVNPRIIKFPGQWIEMREGCLSIPGFFETVRRCTEVVVEHQNVDAVGLPYETQVYTGQLAHVLQHEIEHLDGHLFVEKLPPGRRDALRAHLRKGRG